jgi:hypothetical protein
LASITNNEISQAIWHEDAEVDNRSLSYNAGVATETAAEIALMGLPAGLKKAAEEAALKRGSEYAAKNMIKLSREQAIKKGSELLRGEVRKAAEEVNQKRIAAYTRKMVAKHGADLRQFMRKNQRVYRPQIHHELTLWGHHGGLTSPLPSLGLPRRLINSRLFTRVVRDDAEHALLHRGLRKQEAALMGYIGSVAPARVAANAAKGAADAVESINRAHNHAASFAHAYAANHSAPANRASIAEHPYVSGGLSSAEKAAREARRRLDDYHKGLDYRANRRFASDAERWRAAASVAGATNYLDRPPSGGAAAKELMSPARSNNHAGHGSARPARSAGSFRIHRTTAKSAAARGSRSRQFEDAIRRPVTNNVIIGGKLALTVKSEITDYLLQALIDEMRTSARF